VLWLIVLGSRNVEATKEIPLEIAAPADMVPSNEVPERISFRLSGPKAFLRTVLDRKEDPIRVNLLGAKPGLVTYRFFSDNIRVPIGVKVLSINPTAVLIKLESVRKREVPVRAELRGALPEGYRIVKTEVRPATVKIRGAESRVEAMTEIALQPFDVSNLRQSTEQEGLIDLTRYNVQVEGPAPKLYVEVEPLSANFKIRNVDLRVVSPYAYELREKSVSVLVRADNKDLKSLSHNKMYGVIDLSGKPKGEYQESVKVTLPPGVGLVKVIPDTVHVRLY
jgi:YbbR domain-containing protein